MGRSNAPYISGGTHTVCEVSRHFWSWAFSMPRLLTVCQLTGVPVGLWRLSGAYLPHELPSWEQVTTALSGPDTGAVFLGLLVVIGWAAWAFMALSLVVEAAQPLERREPPDLLAPRRDGVVGQVEGAHRVQVG